MLNAVEQMNFFEGRATEYSKASTKGTWTEAFSQKNSYVQLHLTLYRAIPEDF